MEKCGDTEEINEMFSLLIGLLKINPNERLTVTECLKHKWFNELNGNVEKNI